MRLKKAIFEMNPLKESRPDGFHVCFYQKAWVVVGPSVINQIKRFMDNRTLDEDLNDTLIAFITKIECPTNASYFQPISLCYVIYKVI